MFFEPFCGTFIFWQLSTIFLLFYADRSSSKNILKKSKTEGFTDMFSIFFLKKKIFGEKKKFLTFFGGFPRHFDFSTIINNFSTFLCWYVQPQKYFKIVENSRIYGHVLDFFWKKNFLAKKKSFWRFLAAFRGILIFRQLLTIFLLFYADMSSPRNIFKKSKT